MLTVSPPGLLTRTVVQIMRQLVDAGASVRSCNRLGWTPLHRAAIKNRGSAVVFLVQQGSDVNLADNKSRTPLHHACAFSSLDAIRSLCAWHANPDHLDASGFKCWGAALYSGVLCHAMHEPCIALGCVQRPHTCSKGLMSAELGPKEGAAAKSVLETVLGKELRPSQVVLAQDTSVYLNIGDKDARRAEPVSYTHLTLPTKRIV